MHTILEVLDEINESSDRILTVLNADDPALEQISDEIKYRETQIELLKLMEINEQIKNMREVKDRLAEFSRLHSDIQQKVSKLMDSQQQALAKATKERKVEDMYKKSYHRF